MTPQLAQGKAPPALDGCHPAAFSFGALQHDFGASEIADFVGGLDLVNGMAGRAAGFVWRPDDVASEPAQADGYARWQHRNEFGDSDQAFGWSYLEEAATWKPHACDRIAAE